MVFMTSIEKGVFRARGIATNVQHSSPQGTAKTSVNEKLGGVFDDSNSDVQKLALISRVEHGGQIGRHRRPRSTVRDFRAKTERSSFSRKERGSALATVVPNLYQSYERS